MVAVELEVMAKKMDRFGWDRDRNTAVHDRLLTDWMDALQDYPLDEVRAACRHWVENNPRRMPNEGDIKGLILAQRERIVRDHKRALSPEPEPERERVSAEAASEIMARPGFAPKRMEAGQ